MEKPPDETRNDASVSELVQFDEGLRLGRSPAPAPDPNIEQTQQFLKRLQLLWRRPVQRVGTYVLTRNLGHGTLGMTYQAEDPATSQAFVLKVLWPNLCADAAAHAQLLRDAKSIDSLRHTGIAALREIRNAGQVSYVVSEYCSGTSLAEWRRQYPQPLAWESAVGVTAQLADVIDVAHRHGITHGNLKPSNIFMKHSEELVPGNVHRASLRIADFTLAQAVQQSKLLSHGGLPWPMPQYLAPEQLRHRTRRPASASDLYALGVIAYELLTGRCPVKGTTREEIAATRCAPAPLRHFRPELSRALETLVLQCLQSRWRERPASAKHLADALRALLPEEVEPAQPSWWKQWLGWM